MFWRINCEANVWLYSLSSIPTDLESQGNPEKKVHMESQGNLFYFSKKLENFFLMLIDYHEIKKCCNFHLINVVIIIHAPGKTSHKMLKMVRGSLCLGNGKSQGTFFQIFGGDPTISK